MWVLCFLRGLLHFMQLRFWLTVPENPREWVNLGHSSHFYLVDKVIIDSRLLGTCNCPWQVSEFYQMLGTALRMLRDSFSWAACHCTAAGKQNLHVSCHQNMIPWVSLSYIMQFLLWWGQKSIHCCAQRLYVIDLNSKLYWCPPQRKQTPNL